MVVTGEDGHCGFRFFPVTRVWILNGSRRIPGTVQNTGEVEKEVRRSMQLCHSRFAVIAVDYLSVSL
jgi:hypothetical protein